jgi:ubiquinone/menaquinone biosynthesis C-methylase UbiE
MFFMHKSNAYLMENPDEILRLEVKTDPAAVSRQALWCGVKPGIRVLDIGCGPGKTTAILHEMIQPGGYIMGVDYSQARISHARKQYGMKHGMDFSACNFREPLDHLGQFDLVWVRFILEYYRAESFDMVGNFKKVLKPGGSLCLLDLDYNCLSHYELPPLIKDLLPKIMDRLEDKYNFDAYAGRKLYAYLYDHGFKDIQVNIMAHHIIYGRMNDSDFFNWMKKIEVNADRLDDIFEDYPGGYKAFFIDFKNFLLNPRRFTYTPLILCKGKNPNS